MGTLLLNGCLACVYFTGQSLTLTDFACQVVDSGGLQVEVKTNNYEEVRRSRTAHVASNLHSQIKPHVCCHGSHAKALAHGGSQGAGWCTAGLVSRGIANEHGTLSMLHLLYRP
jgi:hypothetical protein